MNRFAVVAALAIATSAACTTQAADTVQITAHYSHFTPTALTVRAGTAITFRLRNDDPIDHEWIVGDEAVHAAHRTGTELIHGDRPTEVVLPAMTTRSTTVTFDTPGEFKYICHLPGHEAYGMVGSVTVVP